MNQQELNTFCQKVRSFLEETHRFKFDSNSSLGATDFPGGCCDDTSQVLATLIYDEFGIIPKLFRGDYFSDNPDIRTHVWLEVQGLTVDLTLDQFNKYDEDYNFPSVHIGEHLKFFDYFEISETPDGRHSSGGAKNILESVYTTIKQGIKS